MAYGTFYKNPFENHIEQHNESKQDDSDFSSDDDLQQKEGAQYNVILARAQDGNFGIKVKKNEEEKVVVSAILDSTLASLWNVRIGDEVTHINDVPILGSLVTAAKLCRKAGDIVDMQFVRNTPELSITADLSGNLTNSTESWKMRRHKVRPGETLGKIANRYRTTEKQIRHDNRHYFPVGEIGTFFVQQLLIVRDNRQSSKRTEIRKTTIYHTVTDSDTLESIAVMYSTRAADIRESNRKYFPVGEPGFLFPGIEIKIILQDHVEVPTA